MTLVHRRSSVLEDRTDEGRPFVVNNGNVPSISAGLLDAFAPKPADCAQQYWP
jgi:hypothetical protein